jgi:uncharacterized protein (TIGR02284 family)
MAETHREINNDVISTLNNLIEACKDREKGYRTAADAVKNTQFKSLFNKYAQQSAQFASELQSEVHRLGIDPEKSSSITGAIFRGWMNIKSAVTGGDEDAIISECERGEDAAIGVYKDALNASLPTEIQAIVERQYMPIKEGHEHIRKLKKGGNNNEI